jgi:hypothetical protein
VTVVVISQPMFFPWVGMFEQLRLADVFVHYDDVQFSKGSFTNRVQFKTARGSKWLTVPLVGRHLLQLIREVRIDERKPWRRQHREALGAALQGAPHRAKALELVDDVYRLSDVTISELAIASFERSCEYFNLRPRGGFLRSSALGISGRASQRVLDIVRSLGGTRYVTGHGAARYLDHGAFDSANVAVEYMNYDRRPYPQLHGAFDPHVSILDLIANCGADGRRVICSGTIPWREFIRMRESA